MHSVRAQLARNWGSAKATLLHRISPKVNSHCYHFGGSSLATMNRSCERVMLEKQIIAIVLPNEVMPASAQVHKRGFSLNVMNFKRRMPCFWQVSQRFDGNAPEEANRSVCLVECLCCINCLTQFRINLPWLRSANRRFEAP